MVFSDVSDTCYLRAIFASILFPGFFQFQLIGSVEPRGQPCTRRKLHPLFNLKNCNLLQLVAILFLLRTCAVKKGGNETNIRKEPATCRNFQQVHWLCVWRLAQFIQKINSIVHKLPQTTSISPTLRLSAIVSKSIWSIPFLIHPLYSFIF